jgi:hypothetical protein
MSSITINLDPKQTLYGFFSLEHYDINRKYIDDIGNDDSSACLYYVSAEVRGFVVVTHVNDEPDASSYVWRDKVSRGKVFMRACRSQNNFERMTQAEKEAMLDKYWDGDVVRERN